MARDRKNSVDSEMLAQALERHTEALFKRRAGSESTPYKHDPQTASLFRINKRLFETLVPVEPSDAFVDQLKSRLLREANLQSSRQMVKSAPSRTVLRTAFSVFAIVTV